MEALDCMEIAFQAQDKKFLAHAACHNVINSLWVGRMDRNMTIVDVLGGVVTMGIWTPKPRAERLANAATPVRQRERRGLPDQEPTRTQRVTQNLHSLPEAISKWRTDAETFLAAPKTKVGHACVPACPCIYPISSFPIFFFFFWGGGTQFALNAVSHALFLGFFSFWAVHQFTEDMEAVDFVVLMWVLSTFASMLYAFFRFVSLRAWLTDFWNIFDLAFVRIFYISKRVQGGRGKKKKDES